MKEKILNKKVLIKKLSFITVSVQWAEIFEHAFVRRDFFVSRRCRSLQFKSKRTHGQLV